MTTDCWLLFVVILPLVGRCTFVHSFVPKAPFLQHEQTNGRCHELQQQFPHFGIAEWRDLPYEGPLLDLLKTTAATKQQQQQLPKVVSILPFPFNQVLLQGETKELRLYEDRFLQLFDSVMEQQGGIVGMGLLAQSGLIQTIPLCEIEAFQRMEGFGIFVTIRVVGRAQLVAITQQEPYLMGVCLELADEFPQDSTTLQLLTNTMEQTIVTITAMEYRLKKIMEATLLLRDEIDNNNNNNSDDTDDDDMVRRINIAKLEDQFYQDQSVDNDNDMEDIDDDDNDEITELDRRGRFQQAYEIAMETDTQGYLYTSKSSSKLEDLSPKELTALSWAAFCTDLIPNSTDAMFRIQAIDETNIIERLKLASKMLKEKKGRVETQLKKAGLNKEDDDKP